MATEKLLNSITKTKAIRMVKALGKVCYPFNRDKNIDILREESDKKIMSLMIETRADGEN